MRLPMRFLGRLARGDVALWCAFWAIGLPLAIVWDVSGGCALTGCGIEDPDIGLALIGVFTLASAAVVFASVAIWRSASKYPRKVWWQPLAAFAAKACAVLSGLAAIVSLAVIFYMAGIFIYAAFDHA